MYEGIFLGIITWLSLVLSVAKFPTMIKEWLYAHPVIADIAATAITYISLSAISHSLVAAIGAMVAGLLVNFHLMYILRGKHE